MSTSDRYLARRPSLSTRNLSTYSPRDRIQQEEQNIRKSCWFHRPPSAGNTHIKSCLSEAPLRPGIRLMQVRVMRRIGAAHEEITPRGLWRTGFATGAVLGLPFPRTGPRPQVGIRIGDP